MSENQGEAKRKKSFFDNPLLSSKVKSANVKIFPEGGLGYFIGPTLALLTNSILSGNFNRYMSDVLGMTTWASAFFNWLPLISVIFVVLGNILVGRLMDHSKTRAGKARPLLLLSIPVSILALLFLFVFTPFPENTAAGASNITLLVLIAIGYNLWFAVAYPLYFTPHSALVNLSTRNSKDRSLLATISNATALAAMGLCSMVLPFFLQYLFVNQVDPTQIAALQGFEFGAIVDGQQEVIVNGAVVAMATLKDGNIVAIFDSVTNLPYLQDIGLNYELGKIIDGQQEIIANGAVIAMATLKDGKIIEVVNSITNLPYLQINPSAVFGENCVMGVINGKQGILVGGELIALATLSNGSITEIVNNLTNVAYLDAKASFNNWKIFVIALMVITVVGAIVEYLFTRERVTEESLNSGIAERKKSTPISKQAKVCFKDKFWIIILVFFFLYQLGGMLKNVSQTYYCYSMFADADGKHSVAYGGSLQGLLSIIGAVPTALGMVIAWPLSNKIGKGRAILFGAILSVIGGAIGFIAPTNFIVVTVSFVVKALGSTPAMYLSLALLADILDHQEAVHGIRTDGLTMTIYGAIMAGMTGIATTILNVALTATGYDAALGKIAEPATQTAMQWLFIGGETICYALIAILFIFMGVEKFSDFDHKAIVADQKAQAEAEGIVYIDSATKLAQEEKEEEETSERAKLAELVIGNQGEEGLDFEKELAKYQQALTEKQAAAEAKKQAAAEAKAQKEASLTDEQRAAVAKKAELKALRKAEKQSETLKEFNKIREQNNRPILDE